MTAIIKTIQDILKIPELRKRIFLTFSLLFVARLGFQIYLPGINVDAIDNAGSSGDLKEWLKFTATLTGGSFNMPVVFSLGIMPYITASIIFSLLVKVFPRLDALSKEGEQGRKVINRYTRYATVLICLVQGTMLAVSFAGSEGPDGLSYIIDENSAFLIGFMQVLVLTAGSLFMMWLGEKITEGGIGNGASLLIMVGIIAAIPNAFVSLYEGFRLADADTKPFEVVKILMLVLLYFAVVAGVVFITKGQRRIPVQVQRSVRGRRQFGGQRSYMPFKVNPAGVMPIIFAQSLVILPTGVLGYMGNNLGLPGFLSNGLNFISDILQPGQFFYLVTYIIMIFFFTYFWTSLMFNPVEIASNMKENGSFIPGIRPGKRTAEYLGKIMKRITLAGAAFLALIALVPQLVNSMLNVDFMIATLLGGTGILIVVGVALDLVDKIESQMLVRQYEGFTGGSDAPPKKGS